MKGIGHIVLMFVLISSIGFAKDTTQIFTQEQFLWYIQEYHPIAQQSKLLIEQGESNLRKARGSFDPYLFSKLDQKYYDSKQYYSILGSGLKVPTWYGIEVQAGYDQNNGELLNPENSLPSSGLWYAGISVPLGQGLLIDQRRATLKQAKIFSESTFAEQKQLMNNLYYNALKNYWKWMEAWNQFIVTQEALEIATIRFNAVKQSHSLGDKPAIDTLEAFIQVQNRLIRQNEAELYFQKQTLELSNYLWFENYAPLEITPSLRPPNLDALPVPQIIDNDTLIAIIDRINEQHPSLQLYDYKLSSLSIEQQLKADKLKPKLNLKYNALSKIAENDPMGNLATENYKWGLQFSFPLFLRQQRGDLQLTQLKILNTELLQKQKIVQIQNKIKAYFTEQSNLNKQVELYSATVQNYVQLLQGEQKKFDAGESSLFLINSREKNLYKAKQKLIELNVKYHIAQTSFWWASGQLNG